ncbi:hypothetical protein KIPB_001289 [Kipferlia bialata]|uniref:Uncharacterized protein n=1 Tax=Kipferlia bialata TaxID=797122 RepID=A0A9K3CNS3_9EUKA|nr:hypothetical protein KIPB_001289 [Kipferlia bialata]|eukprot:g1289.t1
MDESVPSSPLPWQLKETTAVLVGGCAYVFGGCSSHVNYHARDNLWVYRLDTQQWMEIQKESSTKQESWPTARYSAAVFAIDSVLYVVGGVGVDCAHLPDMWALDTTSLDLDSGCVRARWTRMTDPPQKNNASVAVVLHNRAHILGGGEHDTLHMVYTPGERVGGTSLPAQGTWECLSPPAFRAYGPPTLHFDGSRRVGILGVDTDTVTLNTYDTVSGEWSETRTTSAKTLVWGSGCMLDEDTGLVHGRNGSLVLTGLEDILGDSMHE